MKKPVKIKKNLSHISYDDLYRVMKIMYDKYYQHVTDKNKHETIQPSKDLKAVQ